MDYYPFGMLVPNRHGSTDGYRYGFNGKDKDDEVKGEGNSYDFGARMLDPRVGRWFSTDNVIKAEKSLYQFGGNNPIANIDPDGEDEFYFNYLTGEISYRPTLGRNRFYTFIPGNLDNNKKQIYIPLDPHNFNKGMALKDFTMTYTEQTLICWPFTYDRKNAHWESVAKFVMANPQLHDLMERSKDPDDVSLLKLIDIHNAGLNTEKLLTSFVDGFVMAEAAVKILPALPKLIKTAPKLSKLSKLCFLGGTLVSTENGLIKIEDIKVGDNVWSYNEETGQNELKKVLNLSKNRTTDLINIHFKDKTLVCTLNHPFLIDGNWVEAKDLKVNDKLTLKNSGYVKIESLQRVNKEEIVYNFEVKDNHNYYVSELEVLVHNDCFGFNIKKAVNSNMPHAVERGVERGVFQNADEAKQVLNETSNFITKNKTFPEGSIKDPSYTDRVLVPVGNNGMAAYQVSKNGTVKLKTVLISK